MRLNRISFYRMHLTTWILISAEGSERYFYWEKGQIMLATCCNEMTTRYNWDFMVEKNSCETGREKGTDTDCHFRTQCDSASGRQWVSNSWVPVAASGQGVWGGGSFQIPGSEMYSPCMSKNPKSNTFDILLFPSSQCSGKLLNLCR